MKKNIYNWADLPEEILELIGKRLENRIDVYRFRAICSSWRSVVPLSLSLHSSPHPPTIHFPPPHSATAFLLRVTVCRLEDDTRTAACLIKITPDMKITSPLFPCTNVNNRERNSSQLVNVTSLRVVEVCRGYYLIFSYRRRNLCYVTKVVVFENRGVFAIYDFGKLGFFGFDDEKNWTLLGTEGTKYEDIAFYDSQLYVVDSIGTVYWIDSKAMSLVQFSPPLFGLGQAKNLVVSEGELFVVDSYIDAGIDGESLNHGIEFETVGMRVYRLDAEWGTWVDVKSLGDRVFVLGKEVSFSVSSRDFPGCSRNCVYFLDSKLEDRSFEPNCRRYFGRVFDLEDHWRMKTVDSFPCHRKLFSLPMNFPCTYESRSLGSLETLG